MDLLKLVAANRQAAGLTRPSATPSKASAPALTPGTRAYRKYIIAERPGKKAVKEHLEAVIQLAVESSSDEDE